MSLQNAKSSFDRLVEALGVDKDAEIAERLGVPPGTVSSWRSRGALPQRRILALSKVAGVSAEWLGTGAGEGPAVPRVTVKPSPDGAEPDAGPASEPLYQIPILVDIAAAAAMHGNGDGFLVDTDHVELEPSGVRLPPTYIRQVYGVDPERVWYIHARGNSMWPTIQPGQRVMIALVLEEVTPVRDGLIYVVRAPGGIIIKRLRLEPDYVVVTSDNPDVDAYRVPNEVWDRDYTVRAIVLETAQRH